MPVPTRRLGRNGPLVPAIGFEKLRVLDRAHEIGATFWDTADVYSDSEDRIGEWFKRTGKRADIFIATKFGISISATEGPTVRSDPEYVKEACDKSLSRLGVNTIDLYYCHRIDTTTPIEKTVQAMADLKKLVTTAHYRKIRYLGLSECSSATLRRAHAIHPISAYQIEYNPFCLDIESPDVGILDTCRELGITVVAYSPVGRGLLTGQIKSPDDLPEKDFRRVTPKYSPENFPKILSLVDQFKVVAAHHEVAIAQACLAWLLAQGDDIIPIPGTRTIKYLDQNMEAASLQLTNDEIKMLRQAAEGCDLPGDRYPAAMASWLLRDSPAL
ncbi:hypothetical protein NQ176_g1092 [Zarea fungicola]|uniref:Uncharacterized protein n=1 Tax=Zarea fungicola TaxID=93591 RepID=A0ACC1NWT5_9HYPO|nr:hypothetical protein NQ176_g1092 [Lecanicillium fungicola]